MKTHRKFKCDCGTDPITGRDGYCDRCNDTGFVFAPIGRNTSIAPSLIGKSKPISETRKFIEESDCMEKLISEDERIKEAFFKHGEKVVSGTPWLSLRGFKAVLKELGL
jgi:hypothetical protein